MTLVEGFHDPKSLAFAPTRGVSLVNFICPQNSGPGLINQDDAHLGSTHFVAGAVSMLCMRGRQFYLMVKSSDLALLSCVTLALKFYLSEQGFPQVKTVGNVTALRIQ